MTAALEDGSMFPTPDGKEHALRGFCALCDSSLKTAVVVNTVARNDTPQRMVACPMCAFCQQDPMPTEAEVRAYYESGDYRREFPAIRSAAEEDEVARSGAPFIAQQFPGGGPLLEIGCGFGRMAAITQACATEADPDMAREAEARGVPITRDPAAGIWHGVYALQVLEHQPDPVATLRLWRSYLAPGGRIHVQVPCLERMYRGATYFFQRPHMVNFTARTLRQALAMAGLEQVASGIDGAVLWATAVIGPERTQEGIFDDGTPDDVPAMIAAHEATWRAYQRDHAPSPVERWLSGEGERPGDDDIKRALALFSELATMGMDGVARLAEAAQARLHAMDDQWSLSPWVLGYQAGQASTHYRYQQALAHLANVMKLKAEGGA